MIREQAERLEGELTRIRISELRRSPIAGAFDTAHLREVHRRIFQDFPAAGFSGITPGTFREAITSEHRDWVKTRDLADLPNWTVAYATFLHFERQDRAASKLIDFIRTLLDPSGFVGRPDEFEALRQQLNAVPAFAGLQYGEDGKFRRATAAQTIEEAHQRAKAKTMLLVICR